MNGKHLTFDCYNDPGHGWMKVRMAQIDELGLRGRITGYSYIRGEYVYLEEDCDVSTFIRAMNERGVEVGFRHHYSDKTSRIRSYDRYPYEDKSFSPLDNI